MGKAPSERILDASRILDGYADPIVLSNAICCTLRCMSNARIRHFTGFPPKHLDPECAYMKVDEEVWSWATRKSIQLDYSRIPTAASLLLLRDLGVGLHGHAWLACSEAGLTCVLKVGSLSAVTNTLESELRAWTLANPEAPRPVLCTVMSRQALRMVYAHPVSKGDCDEMVATAVALMAANGVWHQDLHWRHVGKFAEKIVFFDFGKCTLDNRDILTARNVMLLNLGLQ